jgi:hypothetical protein
MLIFLYMQTSIIIWNNPLVCVYVRACGRSGVAHISNLRLKTSATSAHVCYFVIQHYLLSRHLHDFDERPWLAYHGEA